MESRNEVRYEALRRLRRAIATKSQDSVYGLLNASSPEQTRIWAWFSVIHASTPALGGCSGARDRLVEHETQDEDPGTQAVPVRGNTAVVTAHLRIKATTRRGASLS